MKALIVYDSVYGNTEKVARAIAGAITLSDGVKIMRVSDANPSELVSIDFLIVGSPTHGGRPTPAVKGFLNKIPADALKEVGVASFDTRISGKDKGIGIRMLTAVLGYAAGRITNTLKSKGGYVAAPPEGFIVEDKEGPLKQGELERAAGWAKGIVESN